MNVLVRNNVKVSGQGTQPMIFAHGFGCDQTMWRYITPAFENDYRIILFDYVGFGQSDRSAYNSTRYSTLEGYAQDVLDICAALSLEDVVFVGHSISSMIGMLAARSRPGLFKKMIMLGPSACYMNEPGYVGGFEREELESLLGTIGINDEWAGKVAPAALGEASPELIAEVVGRLEQVDVEMARSFARAAFFSDYREILAEHFVPTLLLQCHDDHIAPVTAGEYLRRFMQNSTMVQLKASGHFPHMSAPQETVQNMWNYLYSSHSNAMEEPALFP